ncbi:MAG TPA: hypothetical protein V6D29_08315 [Leptolyngbyaceae cyanobacterium]
MQFDQDSKYSLIEVSAASELIFAARLKCREGCHLPDQTLQRSSSDYLDANCFNAHGHEQVLRWLMPPAAFVVLSNVVRYRKR